MQHIKNESAEEEVVELLSLFTRCVCRYVPFQMRELFKCWKSFLAPTQKQVKIQSLSRMNIGQAQLWFWLLSFHTVHVTIF